MGASLAVQSLGLRACIAGGTVRSLAGELKSLMLRDAATKKKKKSRMKGWAGLIVKKGLLEGWGNCKLYENI